MNAFKRRVPGEGRVWDLLRLTPVGRRVSKLALRSMLAFARARAIAGKYYRIRFVPPPSRFFEQRLRLSVAPWAAGFPAHEPTVVTPPIHFDDGAPYEHRLACFHVFEEKMRAVSHQFPPALPWFRPFGRFEEWREARWLDATDSLSGRVYVTHPFAKVKGPYAMFAMAGIREVGPNSYVLSLWVGAHKLGIGLLGYAVLSLVGAMCLSSVLEDIYLLLPLVAVIYLTAAGEWVMNTFVWTRYSTDESLLKTAAHEAFDACYSHALNIASAEPRATPETIVGSPSAHPGCRDARTPPDSNPNRYEVE